MRIRLLPNGMIFAFLTVSKPSLMKMTPHLLLLTNGLRMLNFPLALLVLDKGEHGNTRKTRTLEMISPILLLPNKLLAIYRKLQITFLALLRWVGRVIPLLLQGSLHMPLQGSHRQLPQGSPLLLLQGSHRQLLQGSILHLHQRHLHVGLSEQDALQTSYPQLKSRRIPISCLDSQTSSIVELLVKRYSIILPVLHDTTRQNESRVLYF